MMEMIQNHLLENTDFLSDGAAPPSAPAETDGTPAGLDRSIRSPNDGSTDKAGGDGLFSAKGSGFAGGGEGGLAFP